MFDRLMLMELRDNVNKLDTTAYAELKSYKEPPEVVHLILKSVLAIFHHSLALEGYFDNWNQCKQVRHCRVILEIFLVLPPCPVL